MSQFPMQKINIKSKVFYRESCVPTAVYWRFCVQFYYALHKSNMFLRLIICDKKKL